MNSKTPEKLSANVFNIQRFSIEDGPGIRTTVFFKGCPLRCLWCSNPESQSPVRQIAHRDSLCNGCGDCLKACPEDAISLQAVDKGFKIKIDRKKCTNCGQCIDVCTPGAMKFFGQTMTIDEVLDEVKSDMGFYAKSGGGVTASGGEPLTEADFVAELSRRCHKLGIHTTLDTCGYASPVALDKVLDELDLILFDVKLMDPQQHKKFTGQENDTILRNARSIVAKKVPMIIRIPLIPDVNDSEDNLNKIAHFVSELDKKLPVNLLPYHRFGENKYGMLDMDYQLADMKPPDAGQLDRAKEIFKRYGLHCEVQ